MHEKAECNIMVAFGEIYLTHHESKAEYSLKPFSDSSYIFLILYAWLVNVIMSCNVGLYWVG